MYLYCIVAENGLFKIGKSLRLGNRIANIKSGSPVACELLFAIEYRDDQQLEEVLHERYQHRCVRGEWFALRADQLRDIAPKDGVLDQLIDDMEEWGFFHLGSYQLTRATRAAVIYRAAAVGELRKWIPD